MPKRRYGAWLLCSAVLLVPLSFLEVSLGISEKSLGLWYHIYMVTSTVLVMAIVWRFVHSRPPTT